MEERFLIRAAARADVPELLRLIRGLAEYEKLADQAKGTAPALEAALFGPRPACEALIAEVGGRAVGFALYFTSFSTFLCKPGVYLEDVFVEPEHRGSGIGKALLAGLAAIAVERGPGRFEWRVLDWNEPSIRFYESLGATIMREWLLARVTGPALERMAAGATSPS